MARRFYRGLALTVSVAVMIILAATALWAQGYGGASPGYDPSQGYGAGQSQSPGPSYGPDQMRGSMPGSRWNYNPAQEMRISGTVDRIIAAQGAQAATIIVIRTENGEMRRVQLGPAWFTQNIGLTPRVGDRVTVIGAPWNVQGQGMILARQINWRGRTYQMRSSAGIPLWSGTQSRQWYEYQGLGRGARAVNLRGVVQRIEYFTPGGRGMGQGVQILIRPTAVGPGTPQRWAQMRNIWVQLGPQWYFSQNISGLRAGQEVSVMGFPAQYGRNNVVIASQLQAGRQVLNLRNQYGQPAWPGGWQNWGGWSTTSYGAYNPNTVQTVSGVVEDVRTTAPRAGMGDVTVVRIRTDNRRTLEASLGPTWYLEQSSAPLRRGDRVTFTGSMVNISGRPMMLVRDMTASGYSVALRGPNGTPLWASYGPMVGGGFATPMP